MRITLTSAASLKKNWTGIFNYGKPYANADDALDQIEEMKYALPFAADPRKIFRIGVSFDSRTRMLADWKVQE